MRNLAAEGPRFAASLRAASLRKERRIDCGAERRLRSRARHCSESKLGIFRRGKEEFPDAGGPVSVC
jgi:hypothetical protein